MKAFSETPQEISKEDRLKELKRELNKRLEVYPEWVRKNTITFKTAQYRIDVLRITITELEKEIDRLKRAKGEQQSIF